MRISGAERSRQHSGVRDNDMYIKKLTARFGCLDNDTLTLEPGLNVVEAPNESGKSTWAAFILAMFYGIDTSERDRAGFIADKTRYRPYSGASMQGAMELEFGGRGIAIERRTAGNSAMRDFNAVYTSTASAVEGLTGENAGERLLGAKKQVFERSAFIRQSGIAVSQTAELEKRMAALASSGEEDYSFSDTEARLRTWLRRRKHNRSGLIPKLEAEYEAAVASLERLHGTNEELAGLRAGQEEAGRGLELLRAEIERCLSYESGLRRSRVREAAERVEELESNYKRMVEEIDTDLPARARAAMVGVHECQLELKSGELEREPLRAALDSAKERVSRSVFCGQDAEHAQKRVDEAVSRYEAKAAERNGHSGARRLLPAILACIALLAGLAVGYAADSMLYATVLGVTLAIAAGVVTTRVLRVRWEREVRAAQKYKDDILAEFGAAGRAELDHMLSDYIAALDATDRQGAKLLEAEKAVSLAQEKLRRSEARLASELEHIEPGANIGRAEELIALAGEKINRLHRLAAELDASRRLYDSLASAGFEQDNGDGGERTEAPPRSRGEVERELRGAEGRCQAMTREAERLQGSLDAMGDPVVIGAKIERISSRLEELRAQYTALELAIEQLNAANTEMQTRFSPALGRLAGEYMKRLTGGRYEELRFDRELRAEVKESGESVSRGVLTLSGGTADQMYLALRLAVCELVLSGDEPCPVILDDALANFDDERMALALDALGEIALKRQVILFSCHTREKMYLNRA